MIPGWLISVLTFPGIIIHEYAHEHMCYRRGVRVVEVCYFRIGNPAGYVEHERSSDFGDTFAISAAPFIINTLLTVIIFIPLSILVLISTESASINENNLILNLVALFIAWLGFSTGMHALPSSTDAKNIWSQAKNQWRNSMYALAGLPLAALFYVGDKLRFFWFDAIYALMLLILTMHLVDTTFMINTI